MYSSTGVTVPQVRDALSNTPYNHLSHHAYSNLEFPIESALQLANGQITLGQLMLSRFPELAEVFLSCCQTNLGKPNLTDELITLGTGFLCAGARSVISTLWSVYQLSTAFFCLAYYAARETQTRSQAIQTAQQQLRSMTGAELKAKLPELTAYFDRQIEQAYHQGDLNLALQLEGAKAAMVRAIKKDG
jgi:CHAT domain-containing protein